MHESLQDASNVLLKLFKIIYQSQIPYSAPCLPPLKPNWQVFAFLSTALVRSLLMQGYLVFLKFSIYIKMGWDQNGVDSTTVGGDRQATFLQWEGDLALMPLLMGVYSNFEPFYCPV